VRRCSIRFSVAVAAALTIGSCRHMGACEHTAAEYASSAFLSNEIFLNTLGRPVPLAEPISVFRYVFGSLAKEVNVYPSENHYYFLCTIKGITLRGSIALLADRRDEGLVSFSYQEEVKAGTRSLGRAAVQADVDLSERDGVHVTKVTDDSYSVTFEGSTVSFKLREPVDMLLHPALQPPGELTLGASFDESGLRFQLLFNKLCRSFLWVLDEHQTVPEEFASDKADIVIGRRTAYVFYLDRQHARKLLVGVRAENVLRNNWYDGPFDQLPDNAIKRGAVSIQQYIEEAYPSTKGRIDRYGVFLDDPEMRVAIDPYLEYSNLREVRRLIASVQRMQDSDSYCALSTLLRRQKARGH
jgi:hypothetical protein